MIRLRPKLATIAVSIVLLFSLMVLHAQTLTSDETLTAELRKSDELLLTAVHTAERAVWQKLAAPDFFYLDEEGGVTYLSDFLRELEPMSSKPLVIQTYKLTRINDTAVVLHEDTDENKVRYIFTETWQQLDGQWKLRALHITNVLSDPPAIALSAAQIDELVGVYRTGHNTCVIRREGDRIIAERSGRPDAELKAETRDVLFQPKWDPRTRMIFLRDAKGRVTGFIVRYESSDTLWTKVP